jgi:predicted TIM-barrel fold metal-dependent hydrolase
MRTVALEEHFWIDRLADEGDSAILSRAFGPQLTEDLRDLAEGRLAAMDASGIDVQVLSHNTPAAQQLPTTEAIPAAREANDTLARAVAAHPGRFAGFATLPTADPAAAADELERSVGEHGFVGAMVNSTLGTNGKFLDDPSFEPLFARAERLNVPLYLHPSAPPDALRETLYGGFEPPLQMRLATGAWGWHAELGLSAVRLVLAGVFERHPNLRVVLGHCGEMLPFMLGRIDQMLPPERTGLPLLPSEYFLRNVWITTSGLFTVPPALCSIAVFGVDRVLFSVDYPYSANDDGRRLLNELPVSPADLAKIAGGNADRLLGLQS